MNLTIDPSAITLIQTNFLIHLNSVFIIVAHYALNLLYIFASFELVFLGFLWAMDVEANYGRYILKIIKIGLIFFAIQNYDWLIADVINSFSQIAGFTINSSKLADFIFNPSAIWQYGYNAGLCLLHQATTSSSIGLTLVQYSLGMGILLVFGLIGIHIVIQNVSFYLTSLIALLFLPLGIFQPTSNMSDRAIQSVLKSGVRVMTMIIIIGIAVSVWDNFNMTDITAKVVNIDQPLGLFFTALLVLNLLIYLPKYTTAVIGSIRTSSSENLGRASESNYNNLPALQNFANQGIAETKTFATIDNNCFATGEIRNAFSADDHTSKIYDHRNNYPLRLRLSKHDIQLLKTSMIINDRVRNPSNFTKSISNETIQKIKKLLKELSDANV